MSFEEEYFEKAKANLSKLIPYGFEKESTGYFYSKDFHHGEFQARIHIREDGYVYGQVIEKAFEEEYTTFRAKDAQGEFVNEIREEYEAVLKDIKDNCFSKQTYVSLQANRINQYIHETFHHEPIFKWDKEPYKDSASVFEDEVNHKWYAIVMRVSRKKLDNIHDVMIEVMNVKLDPALIQDLLKTGKYYPAYHMNKKSWISIPLDNTIPDEEIIHYLTMSRDGIKDNKKKKQL